MTFDEVARRLYGNEEFEHGAGANATTISAAEAALGLAFPESYRRFLASFGWGCIGHFEIHGLGQDVPVWLDIVKLTASQRKLTRSGMNLRIPPYLLPLHNEDDGDQICIDTMQRVGDSAPVVFWDHTIGNRQAPEKIADDFIEWLASLI
ncbi:MAG: SMI1/KNR4 family protein [Betaproteobacteria bacterium]|nr:SMI1/KNR4 family protein [Betaproteobacteria bacterium]